VILIFRSKSVLWTIEWIITINGETNTVLEHKYLTLLGHRVEFRISDHNTLNEVFKPHTVADKHLHFLMKKVGQPV
jgi:hypothetical protein